MKKIICLFGLLLTGHFIYAQKEPINKLKSDTTKPKLVLATNTVPINTNIILVPVIRVYERPNYQGRSAQFIKNAEGKFVFPFPLAHVSFKVPEGMIVYIRTCFEFPSENAYTHSRTDINLEAICGVRTDESTLVRVTFTGISTEIHNDDCMRFAGRIESKMMESAPDEGAVETLMPTRYSARGRTISGGLSHNLFNGAASQLTSREYSPHYNSTGTIFNNNPVPELTQTVRNYFGRTRPEAEVSFYVGKSALREGRVKIWLKTDLTSSHKTCNLCDDFSSGIKMGTPAYESIPLKKTYGDGKIIDATHPYLVVGPYTARGSRDGFAITATAGTIKNFRVHLMVTGL